MGVRGLLKAAIAAVVAVPMVVPAQMAAAAEVAVGSVVVTVTRADGGTYSLDVTLQDSTGDLGSGTATEVSPDVAFTDALFAATDYTGAAPVPTGLYLVDAECNGAVSGVSMSGEVDLHFTYTGTGVESVACFVTLARAAEVQVTKNSFPGPGEFDLTFTNGEFSRDLSMATVGYSPASDIQYLYLPPGTYSLTEAEAPGWINDFITCQGPSGTTYPATAVVLTVGEVVNCTVQNTAGVPVEVYKFFYGGTPPASATFNASWATEPIEVAAGGTPYTVTVPAGSYTLTEIPVPGYDPSLACTVFHNDDSYTNLSGEGPSISFDAVVTDEVICEATNNALPVVNIHKTIDQAGTVEERTFTFTGENGEVTDVVADFDGDGVDGSITAQPGYFTITESGGPGGFNLTAAECTRQEAGEVWMDNAGTDEFTPELFYGDVVDCTVANTSGLDVQKTAVSLEPTAVPGEYLTSWTVTVTNGLSGAVGSLELHDTLLLPFGATAVSGTATGPDGNPVAGWDGVSNTALATGLGLVAGESLTWDVSAVVAIEPNLGDFSLQCPGASVAEGGGVQNEAVLRSAGGEPIMGRDWACLDLPPADLELSKELLGGPTDNGDGTWTQSYLVEVANGDDGFASFDLYDTLEFGAPFTIESVTLTNSEGVGELEGDPSPIQLYSGQVLGAGETASTTIDVVFSVGEGVPMQAPDWWLCARNEAGAWMNGNGLYNSADLWLGGGIEPKGPTGPDQVVSVCHDGPAPNIVADKTVVGYDYVGAPDGTGYEQIEVQFDVVVSNLPDTDPSSESPSGDITPGLYALVDIPGLSGSLGVETLEIELLGVDGGVAGDDYEASVDPGVFGGAMVAQGLLDPGDVHTYHLNVTFEVDMFGFDGECWDGVLVSDGMVIGGGAMNLAMWADGFRSGEGLPFPIGSGQGQLETIVDLPEDVYLPPGIGIVYDCLDLGAIWIDKTVTNDDGGVAEPDDFEFEIADAETGDLERTIGQGDPYLIAAGSYELTEPTDEDYAPGGFECSGTFWDGSDTRDRVLQGRAGGPATEGTVGTPGMVQLDIEPSWGWQCSIVNDDVPADLTVTKSDGDATAVAGGAPITYTFVVTNTGGIQLGDVELRDELPEGWSWVGGSVAGPCVLGIASGSALQCVIDDADLADAGYSVTVTAQARVAADAPSGDYVNVATVNSDADPLPSEFECPSEEIMRVRAAAPNFACETTPVVRDAQMTATKTSSATGPVPVGGSVVFTLTVTNHGPSTVLAGTTMMDDLPSGMNLISINAPGWTCTAVDPVICEYGGVLAVGATAPPVQITTTIASGASGTITNTGTFTGIVDIEIPAEPAALESEGALAAQPVVVTATAVATAVATVQVRSGGTIPETGSDAQAPLWWATAFVGLGAVALFASRRRRLA